MQFGSLRAAREFALDANKKKLIPYLNGVQVPFSKEGSRYITWSSGKEPPRVLVEQFDPEDVTKESIYDDFDEVRPA